MLNHWEILLSFQEKKPEKALLKLKNASYIFMLYLLLVVSTRVLLKSVKRLGEGHCPFHTGVSLKLWILDYYVAATILQIWTPQDTSALFTSSAPFT